jgi:tripartite-type tricarboxylate transporter receptor subunit TctC
MNHPFHLLSKCLLAGLLAWHSGAYAAWPERPITLMVGWVMGSGTDLIARQLAGGLEKELGVPVSVLNIDGADGVFAHSAVAFGAPDGYTIGLVTPDFISAYWLKQTDYSYEGFTPIARVEQSPAVFWVRQDSPWRNLKEALAAILKSPPGTYHISGMAQGGAYHIAMAGLLKANGIRPDALRPVPSDGAQPGLDALANGEVDICPNSLREGSALLKQGRIRALAVLSNERLNAFPDVPTAREASGKASSGGTWRAVLAPAGLPAEIRTRLTEAVVKVADSAEFRSFLAFQGFGAGTLSGEDLRKLMFEDHRAWGNMMGELGLRKRK